MRFRPEEARVGSIEDDPDGMINLFGALRRAMAKTGYSDLKEFQKVVLSVRG